MVKTSLRPLKNQVKKEIEKAKNSEELNTIFNKYLGKKGEITLVLSSLEKLPKVKRAKVGKEANEIKNFLQEKIQEKKPFLAKTMEGREEWFDITAPGTKPTIGHLHPLTQVRRKIEAHRFNRIPGKWRGRV